MKKPDFSNMRKVLAGQRPERPVLFELFMNDSLYARLAGRPRPDPQDTVAMLRWRFEAFEAAGYDYTTVHASPFRFARNDHPRQKTYSLNDSPMITDWASYERYTWGDPGAYDVSHFGKLDGILPEGMKLMVMGPGGVLENVIGLTGYDNLCYMLYEQPQLVETLVEQVGLRLMQYYEAVVGFGSVGFLCSNDDWGFNTQTFLCPADMRKYIFPWHKRIVDLAHEHGKPCILHSCGYFREVMEDVIETMGFDARHSYEDIIEPVENFYETYHGRIGVLGGMDLDFVCRATPQEVTKRCVAMLERTQDRGGYALGTGNSVPEYVPQENYLAIVEAARLMGR